MTPVAAIALIFVFLFLPWWAAVICVTLHASTLVSITLSIRREERKAP